MTSARFQVLRIDHIVLRVVDLQASLRFYVDVLGCPVEKVQEKIGLTQLRAGDCLIDLVHLDGQLGSMGGAPPGAEGRNVDHICLRIDPFEEASLTDYLKGHGITVPSEGAVSRYGAEGSRPSLYIQDPDGNVVELKGPPSP